MAKVIKLKDRQGSVVLPLTRSQLVQVSAITGLDIDGGWSSKSVQDALQALVSYVNTNKASWDADLTKIKAALEGVLDNQKAVVNYVDSQDTTYLALAYAQSAADAAAAQANSYAKAESEAAAAQANSYAEAASKAAAAEQAAKDYADGKFLSKVKMNDGFLNVQFDETNGRYVNLGNIATSEGLQTLTEKVNAIEAAYITKAASEEADQAIITAYENADAALGTRIGNVITSYEAADTALGGRIDNVITSYKDADDAIISGYQAADSAIISAYTAADAALGDRIDALETSYNNGYTALQTRIAANESAIATLNGDAQTAGSVDNKVAAGIASVVASAPADFDTLKEVADWIANDSTGAAAMQNAISTLNGADTVAGSVAKQVKDAKDTVEAHTINGKALSTNPVLDADDINYANEDSVKDALDDLYSQIGAGGSVASQIQSAIEALDADLDATGTAQHGGTFVVSGVTEVDGVITAVDSVEVEAAGAAAAAKTELLGGADTNNNTLGKLADRIDTLDGDAVKSVNGQTPDSNGAVTVNANQIDTVTAFKIGSDVSATTHKVDEVLAAAVFYEELSTSTTYDDVNLTL